MPGPVTGGAAFTLDTNVEVSHVYDPTTNVLEITSEDDATIYYTLDGSDPCDEENDARVEYEKAFTPTGTQTVRYCAIDDEGNSKTRTVKVNFVPSAGTLTLDPVSVVVIACARVTLGLFFPRSIVDIIV